MSKTNNTPNKIICCYTDEQREWLDIHCISAGKKARGYKGKTQSEHLRDALEQYIKNYREE